MPRLSKEERDSIRKIAGQAPLENPPHPPIPIRDFLASISNLPPYLSPEKPVRFTGKHWKM